MSETSYPRDLIGYGRNPPHPRWPGDARICVQLVVNYEEGGENNILHGDRASEAFLSEMVGAAPWPGQRHMSMESIYEYGSRVGFWRLWRMFTERNMPVTVFGVATALQRNPEAVAAMKEAGLGDRQPRPEMDRLQGFRSRGGACASQRGDPHPRGGHGRASDRLVHGADVGAHQCAGGGGGRLSLHGGFLCGRAPLLGGPRQLVVPYTLDANDMRFGTPQGFNSGDQFYAYLKDTFDTLYAEGETAPKMMSVGLHCRLVGRPGRAAALARFLDYVGVARAGLGGASHRYRAPLAHPSPPARIAAEHDEPGCVRRAFRRHLRAFAVDRREGP